jgi:hypothetical protein
MNLAALPVKQVHTQRAIIILLLALFLAGCVALTRDIPATTSANRANNAGWDCIRLADRNASLDDLIKVAGASWETISAVGPPFIYGPDTFPLYNEIARLKGEQIAVKEAMKKCAVP